jgi:hypothetical protein|tara:strand:+ start:325 stop:999 length:675 start_codon:yes stop_codon:yes gene_type:complete
MGFKKTLHIFFCGMIFLHSISSLGQEIGSNSNVNNSSSFSVAPSFAPPKSDKTFLELKANENEYKNPIDTTLKSIIAEENRRNLRNKGIIDPQKIQEEKLQKEMSKINKQYAKIDQYLGGFSSKSKTIVIVCRDFQYPDGDTVTIYLNDEPLIQNIVLTTAFQQFKLPLMEGLNTISFKALNQGTSGPNTASFMVFDENGKVLTSKEWNLATGAKATLSVAKVD